MGEVEEGESQINAPDPSEPEETPAWLAELAAGRFRGVVWYAKAWRVWSRGVPGVLERDRNELKLWDVTGTAVFSVPVARVKLSHGLGYSTFKLRVEDQSWRLWGDARKRRQPELQELADRHQALIDAPRFPGTTDKEYRRTMKNVMTRQQAWYVAWRSALLRDNA